MCKIFPKTSARFKCCMEKAYLYSNWNAACFRNCWTELSSVQTLNIQRNLTPTETLFDGCVPSCPIFEANQATKTHMAKRLKILTEKFRFWDFLGCGYFQQTLRSLTTSLDLVHKVSRALTNCSEVLDSENYRSCRVSFPLFRWFPLKKTLKAKKLEYTPQYV